jgi:hypothetical protein
MIITALDTGTRRGEMLALRVRGHRPRPWTDHPSWRDDEEQEDAPCAERLRAVLEWLRIDAEGNQKSDETLVFSNEIGEPLPHFHDAWLRTVLNAHGIKPRWTARLKHKGLSSESKNAFRKINLRWHDLPHEYASRLVERGVPLRSDSRPARPRVDHHDGTLRQSETGEPADRGSEARERTDV